MSSAEGFKRCDGFVGSIPQNWINTNFPTCPLCGSTDPYWTLKDKMEFTANRVMFRCKDCGCVLSATTADFSGATKSGAFVLTNAGLVNAISKSKDGKDIKTVYIKIEDAGTFYLDKSVEGKEFPVEQLKALSAEYLASQAAQSTQSAQTENVNYNVNYQQPNNMQPPQNPYNNQGYGANNQAPNFNVTYGQPNQNVPPNNYNYNNGYNNGNVPPYNNPQYNNQYNPQYNNQYNNQYNPYNNNRPSNGYNNANPYGAQQNRAYANGYQQNARPSAPIKTKYNAPGFVKAFTIVCTVLSVLLFINGLVGLSSLVSGLFSLAAIILLIVGAFGGKSILFAVSCFINAFVQFIGLLQCLSFGYFDILDIFLYFTFIALFVIIGLHFVLKGKIFNSTVKMILAIVYGSLCVLSYFILILTYLDYGVPVVYYFFSTIHVVLFTLVLIFFNPYAKTRRIA